MKFPCGLIMAGRAVNRENFCFVGKFLRVKIFMAINTIHIPVGGFLINRWIDMDQNFLTLLFHRKGIVIMAIKTILVGLGKQG